MDIRVGKIIEVWTHEDSKELYLEKIDLGNGDIRTVASGLQNFIPIKQMDKKMVVVLCNLKPRKMKVGDGFESQGMVLCGETEDRSAVELIEPPKGSQPGDLITFEGQGRSPPEGTLNSKKFEKVQPDMNINGEGVACYKEIPFATEKGPCKVKKMRSGIIK